MIRENGTFALFAIFLIFFCDRTSSECAQLTPCSCMYPDGQGYDLTSLTHSGVLEADGKNYTFYFHPCKNTRFGRNVTSVCDEGDGSSLCLYDMNKNQTLTLGTAEETKVEVAKNPVLILQHGQLTTTIELLCCSKCKSQLNVNSVPSDTEYQLTLTSTSACKVYLHVRGLSTGSILVILFFVFTGIYFIGGAIALKLLRGATGWEMLPNHEFWCELPSLVRDGIVFTFNCFRVDSYERI